MLNNIKQSRTKLDEFSSVQITGITAITHKSKIITAITSVISRVYVTVTLCFKYLK